jgi:hypothetical protein
MATFSTKYTVIVSLFKYRLPETTWPVNTTVFGGRKRGEESRQSVDIIT